MVRDFWARALGLTPDAVDRLTRAGHGVLIEGEAGRDAGFEDDEYRAAGADVTWNAAEVADRAQALIQVHAPSATQPRSFREDGFIHLATAPAPLRKIFRDRRITAIGGRMTVTQADLLVGAIAIPGRPTPGLLGPEHIHLPSEVAHTASIARGNSALPYLLRLEPRAPLSTPGPLRRGCVLDASQPCHPR